MAINHDKSKVMDEDMEGLPQLTDKQYKFVEWKLKGASNAEAYRQAYSSTRMKHETIWRNAAAVASNNKVSTWINHFQLEACSKLLDATSYTLEQHIAELDRIGAQAAAQGQNHVALQAAHYKGKALNHYTEHKQVNITTQDVSMLDKLEALLGYDARVSAATSLGIDSIKHLDS